MSNPYNDINYINQQLTNRLLNESERNATTITDTPNFSTFNKSFQLGTTFNAGYAIPILLQECYPSDIYDININAVLRLSAQASTPLSNINYDVNYFFVPYNQIDDEFKNLMGENNSYGYSDTNLNLPLLNFDKSFKYTEHDLANYFNIPINTDFVNDKIQIYPFLAYGKIWNEWYRDENLQDSIDITSPFNETRTINISENKNSNFYETIKYGVGLAPTSKLPSYFVSCLPYQQKGQPINIAPYSSQDLAKVLSINSYGEGDTNYNFKNDIQIKGHAFNNYGVDDFSFISIWNSQVPQSRDLYTYSVFNPTGGQVSPVKLNLAVEGNGETLQSFNINDLRYSIVSQHLLENWALCGSRYQEQLSSIWGIEINPLNINRTELIGGMNDTLIFNNVLQTSQNTDTSRLGTIASNLYNNINSPKISYACEQHGYIIGILTCRTSINNGGQGLPKLFKYNDYLDFFNPLFNGIGEQPIYNYELYYSDDKDINNQVFGFNEPFLNTKYNIDNANGFLSLNSNTSLFSQFLFGEKYTSTPLLSANWITYNPNIIGNTLYKVDKVNNEFYHQFLAFISFDIEYTTKQPLFSTPKVYGI